MVPKQLDEGIGHTIESLRATEFTGGTIHIFNSAEAIVRVLRAAS
jgi:hypothetical protein